MLIVIELSHIIVSEMRVGEYLPEFLLLLQGWCVHKTVNPMLLKNTETDLSEWYYLLLPTILLLDRHHHKLKGSLSHTCRVTLARIFTARMRRPIPPEDTYRNNRP